MPPHHRHRNMRSQNPERFTVEGEVYRNTEGNGDALLVVRHRRTGIQYFEKQFAKDSTRIWHAKDEIEVLHQLREAHYTHRIFDFFWDDRKRIASIWMELDGDEGNLHQLIQRHASENLPVFEKYAWKVFLQVARAIRYLHYGHERYAQYTHNWRPIIHRNLDLTSIWLKRGNLPTPDVRVAQFGCARHEGRRPPESGHVYGMPEFFPPEHPEFSKASDVYQIGNIMACLISLNLYPTSNPNTTYHVNSGMIKIIKSCIIQEPMRRTNSDILPDLVLGGRRTLQPPGRGRLLLKTGPIDVDVESEPAMR